MNWISVKDRLPEYTTRAGTSLFVSVLICLDTGFVGEGLYVNDGWELLGVYVTNVTHWMPLPEPPEEPS